jgi:3-methyladenine DNA glycosylase Tag
MEAADWKPGDRAMKFSDCARQKYGRSARWLWSYLKKHPDRLKVLYLDGAPCIIERHADEDLARNLCERAAA